MTEDEFRTSLARSAERFATAFDRVSYHTDRVGRAADAVCAVAGMLAEERVPYHLKEMLCYAKDVLKKVGA